jgi:hypothetical protein
MAHINIEFTLFSAFYSPLILLMSGGFLQAEGLEADWKVSPPGVSAVKALEEGRADVIQSAPSQAFTTLARGETPTAIHFAQINEMDGFFITGRAPDPDFDWKRLEGSEVILFGGGQPLAMFKYACHKAGIDFAKLKVIGLGSAEEMDKAFQAGKGQYVQQQGPFPQQLEADGVATSLRAVAQRSDLSLFRAWRRRGIGCNPMSPRPSCAPIRRHEPTCWRRRRLRSPRRKNRSSLRSSLMSWHSVSQAINDWAAGLHMWRSPGRLSR